MRNGRPTLIETQIRREKVVRLWSIGVRTPSKIARLLDTDHKTILRDIRIISRASRMLQRNPRRVPQIREETDRLYLHLLEEAAKNLQNARTSMERTAAITAMTRIAYQRSELHAIGAKHGMNLYVNNVASSVTQPVIQVLPVATPDDAGDILSKGREGIDE